MNAGTTQSLNEPRRLEFVDKLSGERGESCSAREPSTATLSKIELGSDALGCHLAVSRLTAAVTAVRADSSC